VQPKSVENARTSALFEDIVGPEFEGLRLDVYLAAAIEDASRSFLQKLIKEGRVTVNDAPAVRASKTVSAGDAVVVELPPPPEERPVAEDIPLVVVYEDDDLIVIDKPSGMVVHPAPGHSAGTLVNALMFHCPEMAAAGGDPYRPGIVHRIDRHTSGLLVVAKSSAAFRGLGKQVREHAFDRRYLAIVRGEFKEDRGRINVPVGRSLSDPGRMSVTGVRGREAITRFETLERFHVASLVGLVLETGRTHQIRVHLRYAGRPVLGDPVYGVTDFGKWPVSQQVKNALAGLDGQALHAERLGFEHPVTHERLCFSVPPPPDFQAALDALRKEYSAPPS